MFYSITVDYAEGAIASAQSVWRTANAPERVRITFVVESEREARRVQQRLDTITGRSPMIVVFATSITHGWTDAPESYRYLRHSSAIWTRFLYTYPRAPSPLAAMGRYVYLDADTIVQQPIEHLVHECAKTGRMLCGCIGHVDGVTLNSGVLVFDTARWPVISGHNCLLESENDTDMLHCLVPSAHDRGILPPEWNVLGLGEYLNIPEHVLDSAAILHWTGARKPWKRNGLYVDRWSRNSATLSVNSHDFE